MNPFSSFFFTCFAHWVSVMVAVCPWLTISLRR
jgi:hypothetical protein